MGKAIGLHDVAAFSSVALLLRTCPLRDISGNLVIILIKIGTEASRSRLWTKDAAFCSLLMAELRRFIALASQPCQ